MPVAMIGSYPSVFCHRAHYRELMNTLAVHPFFEVDELNETVRMRESWEKVFNFFDKLLCDKLIDVIMLCAVL